MSDPMMKAFNTAQRPEMSRLSRAGTRTEIETNTAQLKVAIEIEPIAWRLPAHAMAQRLLSTILDPVNEKGTMDITATVARNHHTVNTSLMYLSWKSALLTRTRKRKVPRQVVAVANELITWSILLHRLGPKGVIIRLFSYTNGWVVSLKAYPR